MIPTDVRDFVEGVQNDLGDPVMYFAGGCLLDRPAQDYDVLVLGFDGDEEEIMSVLEEFKVKTYPSYPDEVDNPYFMIASCYIEDTKVDFLFVKDDMDILAALDRFPLSIQMQAEDVFTEMRVQGCRYSCNPISVFLDGKSFSKYKKYYPNTDFLDETGKSLDDLSPF